MALRGTERCVTSHDQTLAVVRRAVRSVVESTPELRERPQLQRRVAERMVGVSLAAAELIAEEDRLSRDIAKRANRDRAPARPR